MKVVTDEALQELIDSKPRFLRKRLVDCLTEVERLAAIDYGPLDQEGLRDLLRTYRRESKRLKVSDLKMSLKLWVALAALDTAYRDLKEFNPVDHLTANMVKDVRHRFAAASGDQRRMPEHRDTNEKPVKPIERKTARYVANLMIETEEPLLHLCGPQERAEAMASMKRRTLGQDGAGIGATMARNGLNGVRDVDLARHDLARELAQRMRDNPDEFVCKFIASAYARSIKNDVRRGAGENYDPIRIRALAKRKGWYELPPGSPKRTKVIDAIIEEEQILGIKASKVELESTRSHLRRILRNP